MSIKTVIANPSYLYSIVWGSTLVLYILHYSDLYPKIGNELLSFLLFTLLVSFFIRYRLKRSEIRAIDFVKYRRMIDE